MTSQTDQIESPRHAGCYTLTLDHEGRGIVCDFDLTTGMLVYTASWFAIDEMGLSEDGANYWDPNHPSKSRRHA